MRPTFKSSGHDDQRTLNGLTGMSLSDCYQRWCRLHDHHPDSIQLEIVKALQSFENICVLKSNMPFRRFWPSQKQSGVFLWGPPGSGKSTIVRMMCDRLQQKRVRVLRVHQHDFNGIVQQTLNRLTIQKKKNPIQIMMKSWSQKYDVIYLDDIHLTDVAGVALLHKIWQASARFKVSWLITSNRAPEDLYPNGINRKLVLQTADEMSRNLKVLKLDTKDYRIMDVPPNYHQNSHDANMKHAASCFRAWSGQDASPTTLYVVDRKIEALGAHKNVLMIDFDQLCCPPRSAHDFAWLAKHFTLIIVVNVRAIKASQNGLAISWIRCIDLFYDRQITLHLSGMVRLDQIYQHGQYHHIYQRTHSRLQEMLRPS